ncbi:MAG: hypothetical protein ACREQM_03850 [Candidatus Dormibacteraceae bacterium]
MTESITSPAASTAAPGRSRWIVVAGLVAAIVLGIGGSIVHGGSGYTVAQHLSSLGMITGTTLLAINFGRQSRYLVAAGFVLLALAEAIVLSAPVSIAGEATFASGVALYVPALLLASLPAGLPVWSRVVGGLAAIPFAVYAALNWLGQNPSPGGLVVTAGYVLLSVAAIGWIVHTLRNPAPASR